MSRITFLDERIPCVSVDKKERRVILAPSRPLASIACFTPSPERPFKILDFVSQPVDVAALPKFNMTSYESCMSAKDVKSLAIRHDIPLDLHPITLTKGWNMDKLSDDMIGLYEQYFEFSGIRTDHQKEIEEEDPKIVATRERKSTRAAPKREKEKERRNEGEGSSPQSTNAEEGESSRWRAFYVPEWFIHLRCRVDTLMWCRELMVHLAPPAAQEEANALNNATAFERAWFSLAQGALAQTNILERFEHLQADYEKLAETHSECEETVGKLIQARVDLEHNAKLYNDMVKRYRKARDEHNQALRIKELEDELARKDFALVYAERISAERAQKKEKLVTELGRTKMEKFDCIRKLLPTVVDRLFQSHEYKKSLSKPFNLTIQAGWAKGLAEGRSKEDIMDALSKVENSDPYSDKKMYIEYDKLFAKRYPYVERISHGFRHSVSDLLKIYPDPPPSGQVPATTTRVPDKTFVPSSKAPASSAPKKT
ncbi:hypothetical protein Tco_1279306 [Tanacetum coccineum]